MKPFLSILLIVALLSASLPPMKVTAQTFDCSAVTEIPQTECEALVALYNSTNGEDWSTHTNWLVTDTPSDWFGVTVESGHVTEISLQFNQLSGNLPTELVNLSYLKKLSLDSNKLTGSIPIELGSLSALVDLSLTGNQLSGTIPNELANLSDLEG